MTRTAAARICLVGLIIIVISACGHPYGLRVSAINYESPQANGSITFTDPRLYRREALINERQEEIKYLSDLLGTSGSLTFEPEVLRDLETITSFSAALGLRFDPTAALNFRRDRETSDIQQEIATLRLQMELEQLRRNADLLRASLPDRTTSNDATVGTGTTTAAPDLQSGLTQQTAQQLTAAIAQLQTNLGTRLDGAAARTALSAPNARASPIDTFQDRAAYRRLVESARNAASTDELHDSQGSALVRLYFAATVLPPAEEYRNALGVLRMQVVAPRLTEEDVETVYRQWLRHVNRNLNVRDRRARGSLAFVQNLSLQGLGGAGDLFELVYYYYPTGSSPCPGISFDVNVPAGCAQLVVAAPRPQNVTMLRRGDQIDDLESIFISLTQNVEIPRRAFVNAAVAMADQPGLVSCENGLPRIAGGTQLADGMTLDIAVSYALYARFLSASLSEIELQALGTLANERGPRPPRSQYLAQLDEITVRAERLLADLLNRAARAGCPVSVSSLVRAYVPERFARIVTAPDQRMAVYDVGPREQVQRISSVARAADAISLAASISAQAPSSGVGADGAAGFQRSAIGRADAVERVPIVVAFAEARATNASLGPAFGWLLGPRVTVDPTESDLALDQQLRSYDLSVDLAVPGWWPYVYLDTETAWAPNWRAGDGRTVAADQPARRRQIRVNLSTNSADLASLSAMLSGNAMVRTASVQSVTPSRLSACATNAELQIVGENIWRATTVIVGGRRFDTPQVRVLPDMNGVSVSIDRATFPALENRTAQVTVLTPYGRASDEIEITDVKADGSCKPPQEPEPANPAAGGTAATGTAARPTIASLSPATINLCNPNPSFQLTGRNLRGILGVRLGSATGSGAELPPGDGTLASASFSALPMRTLFTGIATTDLVIRTAQGQATAQVTLVAPAQCPGG